MNELKPSQSGRHTPFLSPLCESLPRVVSRDETSMTNDWICWRTRWGVPVMTCVLIANVKEGRNQKRDDEDAERWPLHRWLWMTSVALAFPYKPNVLPISRGAISVRAVGWSVRKGDTVRSAFLYVSKDARQLLIAVVIRNNGHKIKALANNVHSTAEDLTTGKWQTIALTLDRLAWAGNALPLRPSRREGGVWWLV